MADIVLEAGGWRAICRPDLGGSLVGLARNGLDILRPAPGARDVLESACFPMVPFCNRIADGRFTFNGQSGRIAPNLPPQPHPLHGFGWRAEWDVVRADASSLLLEHRHAGSAEWPWAYRAHQHVALDVLGVTIRLMLENMASEPAPVGLGLHPYFRRLPEARVTFDANSMLGIDADFLPDGECHAADALADWTKGAALPDQLVDHCFTGWGGVVTISDGAGTITMRGFGAPHLHVYAPPGGSELCAEPVSHTPDALNRQPSGMTILPPGACAGLAMRIEASD